jgi:hypothetical protein
VDAGQRGLRGGAAISSNDRVRPTRLLTPEPPEVGSDSVRWAPVDGSHDSELALAVRGLVLLLWAGEEVVVPAGRSRSWERA